MSSPFHRQDRKASRLPSSVSCIVGLIVIFLAAAVLWAYFVVCAYLDTFGVIPGFIPGMQAITDLADLAVTGALWGQFGDFVGGLLNPLMTFLSFLALCITIVLQNVQLRHSANELELSRKALEQGQAIQLETKQALDFQNELASAEKDFNAMVTTISMFNERIEKAQGDYKIELAREENKSSERLQRIQNFIYGSKRKSEALEDLLEKEYDKLLDRIVLSSGDRFSAAKLRSTNGYSYKLTYESNANTVHGMVFKNGVGNNYHFTVEGAPEQKLLPRRFDSINNAMLEVMDMIDYHREHGIWPVQTKISEDKISGCFTVNFPPEIPYKNRRS